jgi:hypothetical protein
MKRVGAIEYEKYILPVGLLIGGYIVLNKLGLFGSAANSSNNATTTANNSAAVAKALAAANAAGSFQTSANSDAVLSGYATAIYQAGISSPVDQDGIVYTVINVNTLADLLRLIQLFATKQVAQSSFDTCSLLGFNCTALDLGGFLHAVLDMTHLTTINNYLSSTGINYQF